MRVTMALMPCLRKRCRAAKIYYETFKRLKSAVKNPLKIATIFSFAANEEQDAIGDIADESFEVEAMNSTAKEF